MGESPRPIDIPAPPLLLAMPTKWIVLCLRHHESDLFPYPNCIIPSKVVKHEFCSLWVDDNPVGV
jgi:hypothetical protein